MSQYNDGGKGSCQRPVDQQKYASNYDAIFRKKEAIKDVDYGIFEDEKLNDATKPAPTESK